MLDFSEYPEDSKNFDPVSKKVIDKINDEMKEKIINEKWKSSLSCFDGKRYIPNDGINSMVYFHKAVKSQ